MKRRDFFKRAPAAVAAAAATAASTAAAEEASLVNLDRLRSSLRRLFSNSWDEVLGELLQNSQRAKAKTVNIETGKNLFRYYDDGHGILKGRDGFGTMLRLADSHFDNETLDDQNPMGLGLHALLAHEYAKTVTFESAGLGIAIDCRRWWLDKEYYSSWASRLVPSDVVAGFRVTVVGQAGGEDGIGTEIAAHIASNHVYDPGPQRGYQGLLRVFMNGVEADVTPPDRYDVEPVMFRTKYRGCSVAIGLGRCGEMRSSVNWYGQELDLPISGVQVRLLVRRGRPINLKSPVRSGVIEDAAWADFKKFVDDAVFAYVCDRANQSKITPAHVAAIYAVDSVRADRESPYYVAKPILGYDSDYDIDRCEYGKVKVWAYDALDQPTVLEDGINLSGRHDPKTYEYGLGTFVAALADYKREFARLQHGSTSRLAVHKLLWRPGELLANPCGGGNGLRFVGRGHAAVVKAGEKPVWQSLGANVVVNDEGSSYDILDVFGLVGCAGSVEWLRSDQTNLLFSYNEEGEYDVQRSDFTRSITEAICRFLGDAVPHDIALDDLVRRGRNQVDREIKTIAFADDVATLTYNDEHVVSYKLIR